MIPVLGIPVLNRPDLLQRCLASIDVDVDRLVLIDNGGVTDDLPEQYWPAVTIPPSNLGVAASWNFIIRTTPAAPWWCLVNADVEFAPGDLARLADVMADPSARVACLVEFGAFGINAACVDRVGWVDESFVPIYCEDIDYRYRCRLAGVPVVDVPSGATHVGSVSYRSDPERAAHNARTYPLNVAYYEAKWGGPMGRETYRSPFNRGGPVSEWHLDRRRLADQAWT